jgi:S1-C subfamily serine protease
MNKNLNENYQNIIEKSVVQIYSQKIEIDLNHPLNIFKTSQSTGTGFFIANNEILTCYHVVNNSLDIKINLGKNECKAKIKYIFPDDDLAILSFENSFSGYNVLDYKIIKEKGVSDVTTVGYPYNSKNLIITKGIISGYQDSLIQTDSPLNSGNSGGPILIDNKFIGINHMKMTGDASNIGFSIPVFRFLIIWKLKKDNLKLINYKPKLLFKFQQIKQKEFIKSDGVIITKLHNESPLKKIGIDIGDYLISINNSIIDNDGFIQFNFFPEKISLDDIHLWFLEDDIVNIKFFSVKNKSFKSENLVFKNIYDNLINYHYGLTDKYYYENNGLILSIFTDYHLENFKDLNINILQRLQIFERVKKFNNKFTVYLADVNYSKLKFTNYPVGDIILEINDILIDNIDTFKKVILTPLNKIKTINNETYFV